MPASTILVDGANVVGSRPDGWWRDRAGAAARLLTSLSHLAAGGTEVLVVLEGQARAGAVEGDHDGVRVVHAPGEGDDTLAALCAPGVTLISADRGLRERAEQAGADVRGPRWLLEQLTP